MGDATDARDVGVVYGIEPPALHARAGWGRLADALGVEPNVHGRSFRGRPLANGVRGRGRQMEVGVGASGIDPVGDGVLVVGDVVSAGRSRRPELRTPIAGSPPRSGSPRSWPDS